MTTVPKTATTTTATATATDKITRSSVTASCRVSRAALLASLAEAKGYVGSKHAVLNSVCLSFSEAGMLKITATDCTRWYMDTLTVDDVLLSSPVTWPSADHHGTITVACDARKLHDIVKAMDVDETVLTLKGTLTTISTIVRGSPQISHESLVQVVHSSGEYNVKGPDATSFPKPPTFPSQWYTFDASALRSALDTAQPFVLKDLTRTHISAALVEIEPRIITAVSTDGQRLAKIVREASHSVVTKTQFLVPLVAIGDLLDRCKALSKREAPGKRPCAGVGIEMGLQGNTVFWRGEGARHYAVWHEVGAERYPHYNQVIPRTFDRGVTVERAPLMAALKRLLLVASSKTCGGALNLPASSTMPPHVLLIETDDGEGQAAKEKITFHPDAFAGMVLRIGVNLKYLLEALDSFTDKNVWLGFNGKLDPIGVKADRKGSDIIVIMPMHL